MDRTIGPARYSNILTWFRGFQDKDIYFLLGTKRQKNLKRSRLQLWPESVGAMLEFWYVELTWLIHYELVTKLGFLCWQKEQSFCRGNLKKFCLEDGNKTVLQLEVYFHTNSVITSVINL